MTEGTGAAGHVAGDGLVRQLRRAACLTQQQLGREIGAGQQVISNIGHGRVARPACLAALAAFFGRREQDLLTLPGPAPGTPPPGPVAGPAYWSVPAAAAALGIGRKQVYQLVRAGGLPARRAGRSLRIAPAAVRAYQARTPRLPRNRIHPGQQHPALVRADPGQLRALREERGWTRLELAARAGVSWPAVSALETGHRTRTSSLPALARALGTQPAALQASPPAASPARPAATPAAASGRLRGRRRIDERGPHPDGTRLRALRAARGLTQAELARRAGLSRPVLSMLENGHLQRSSLTPALAQALGAAPGDLTAPDSPAHVISPGSSAPPGQLRGDPVTAAPLSPGAATTARTQVAPVGPEQVRRITPALATALAHRRGPASPG
jgi:excisionase family DNA binding protein